jgi:hypothetical protein
MSAPPGWPHLDQVVAALERYVLLPEDHVESSRAFDDGFDVMTSFSVWYDVKPGEWLFARESWVQAAFRVVEGVPSPGQPARTVGLVFERGGGLLHLNDVAVVRALGRRLGHTLDPLAYAEILAEFHSDIETDRPVVTAWAPGLTSRAGWLVTDPEVMATKFPWVDRALFAPPEVHRSGDELTIDFVSCHQAVGWMPPAVSVVRWAVIGAPDRDPLWTPAYLGKRIEMP